MTDSALLFAPIGFTDHARTTSLVRRRTTTLLVLVPSHARFAQHWIRSHLRALGSALRSALRGASAGLGGAVRSSAVRRRAPIPGVRIHGSSDARRAARDVHVLLRASTEGAARDLAARQRRPTSRSPIVTRHIRYKSSTVSLDIWTDRYFAERRNNRLGKNVHVETSSAKHSRTRSFM